MSVSKHRAVQNVKWTQRLDGVVLNPSLSPFLSFSAKGEARHTLPSTHRDQGGEFKCFPMIKSSVCSLNKPLLFFFLTQTRVLVPALLKGRAGPASALSLACTDRACKRHLPRSQAMASANWNSPVFWFSFVFLSNGGGKGPDHLRVTAELYLKHLLAATGWCWRSSAAAFLQ